jgi:heat shock protein HspQ
LHENVKTTPFYQLVLNLLSNPQHLHPAEQKLLTDFLQSVPKVGKQTVNEFMQEVNKSVNKKSLRDLEPYYKVHAENMPRTNLLYSCEVSPILHEKNLVPPESSKYFYSRS